MAWSSKGTDGANAPNRGAMNTVSAAKIRDMAKARQDWEKDHPVTPAEKAKFIQQQTEIYKNRENN